MDEEKDPWEEYLRTMEEQQNSWEEHLRSIKEAERKRIEEEEREKIRQEERQREREKSHMQYLYYIREEKQRKRNRAAKVVLFVLTGLWYWWMIELISGYFEIAMVGIIVFPIIAMPIYNKYFR